MKKSKVNRTEWRKAEWFLPFGYWSVCRPSPQAITAWTKGKSLRTICILTPNIVKTVKSPIIKSHTIISPTIHQPSYNINHIIYNSYNQKSHDTPIKYLGKRSNRNIRLCPLWITQGSIKCNRKFSIIAFKRNNAVKRDDFPNQRHRDPFEQDRKFDWNHWLWREHRIYRLRTWNKEWNGNQNQHRTSGSS